MFDILAIMSFVIVFVLVIALVTIIGYYNDMINIQKNNYERLYNSWSEVIEEIKTVKTREKQALDDLKYVNNMNLSLENTVENQQKEITRLESKLINESKLEKYLDSNLGALLTKVVECENHAQSSAVRFQQYKDQIKELRTKIQTNTKV